MHLYKYIQLSNNKQVTNLLGIGVKTGCRYQPIEPPWTTQIIYCQFSHRTTFIWKLSKKYTRSIKSFFFKKPLIQNKMQKDKRLYSFILFYKIHKQLHLTGVYIGVYTMTEIGDVFCPFKFLHHMSGRLHYVHFRPV